MIEGPRNRKTPQREFFLLVAGPRLARGSAGYEPTEILLLYPAMDDIVHLFYFKRK